MHCAPKSPPAKVSLPSSCESQAIQTSTSTCCPICTCTCARVSAQAYDVDARACSVSCKYEYYRVVYTSSLQGLHYTLISLREPCRDGLYKWWPYDNTVTLTTRILLRRSSLQIEYTMNRLIIKDRGHRNTKDADFSVLMVQ